MNGDRASDDLHQRYVACVGETFRVAIGTGSTDLTLDEVSAVAESGGYRSWTLTFSGPTEAPLAQATWTITHERLGTEAVFLVPVDRSRDAVVYEAVFSLVVGGA